jgi:hypothetical protein
MINNYSCEHKYQNVLHGYSEKQHHSASPFYHSDLKDSLEKIVIKEVPSKNEGMLEKVFTDKGKNLKATIKALFKEIKLRERLDSHLLGNIDNEIYRQHGYLSHFNTGYLSYPIDPTKNLTIKTQLENNVLELEKEKRREHLECWSDLMTLKRYLFGSLKDYWDLSKKREALAYDFK